ncbi:hypothetical protein [Nocardioides ferulae]|uniref:hypothetical protein n=1 Tax=Nocardioides ferulae TaxID=2340821 RepID=UPI000EABA799|nr:hypothetical protein [Nocardioides ferulae]
MFRAVLRVRGLVAAAIAVAVSLALSLGPSVGPSLVLPDVVRQSALAGPPEEAPVRVYDYDLGDAAFTVRGFNALGPKGPTKRLAPIELTGRVYAPEDAAGRRLPMVVIAHGLFWTCADEEAASVRAHWPCRRSFTSIRSDRGYDYLGRAMAAQGMVVVSVGANGVNAGELGEVADRARGSVIYRHLRLWRNLVERGTGRLSGALVDAATGGPAYLDLHHAVDFAQVGLLGHSRGGRGVMWAAADAHRARVPEGVRLRAVFGLAAAEPPFMDRATRRLEVGRIPLMTWAGTCDVTGRDEYNRLARRLRNPVNIGITVHGANHNNLNSRWAAESGLPGGEDDASHPEGRPDLCYAWDDTDHYPTLGYDAEQRVAETYVVAFFGRYLQGRRGYDGVLSGEELPVDDLATVEVRRY